MPSISPAFPDDAWVAHNELAFAVRDVHGANPGGPSEALWTVLPQYTHFLVIRYNMPAVPHRGSGIFLHETANRSTLGCVSLPHANLVALLRWLDPAASPRIVLAPASALNRY